MSVNTIGTISNHSGSGEEHLQPEFTPIWKFSGCYPFNSSFLPFDLAFNYQIKLLDFKDDIVGLILPYSHGFDDNSLMGLNPLLNSNVKFLHLFNLGDTEKKISRIVDGIAFTVRIPFKKRMSLHYFC